MEDDVSVETMEFKKFKELIQRCLDDIPANEKEAIWCALSDHSLIETA